MIQSVKNRLPAGKNKDTKEMNILPEKRVWVVINRLSLLFQAMWSIFLYFVIEAMSRHSLGQAWDFMVQKPEVFLYNAGIRKDYVWLRI